MLTSKYPVIILVLLLLLGCGDTGTESRRMAEKNLQIERYYPLKGGMKLITDVKTIMTSGTEVTKEQEIRYSFIYFPAQELQGKTVFPVTLNVLGTEQSSITYFINDGEGIYVAGHQTLVKGEKTGEPKLYEYKYYVLKKPIKIGSEWWNEGGSSFKFKQPIKIKFTIENIGDTVSVDAGTFKECLKVSGNGSIVLQDGANIKRELTVWYAPEIGRVKSIDIDTITENGNTKMRRSVTQLESIDK
jgi:hypothetical protein